MDKKFRLSTEEKALRINLDSNIYGCFGEIGAGQEVAANFFRAGGSSGTIAYSQSAYDMKISDSLYGEADRYVCEERLMTMLEKEFDILKEKLPERGESTKLFAFANTVEALNYHQTNQGHGWVGLMFQVHPNTEPNHCVIHVKMHDKRNTAQQEALGILGVNLMYACFYDHEQPEFILDSLFDRLARTRIEIDMFRLRGPDFRHVDNRLMSLKLVKKGMTDATMFDPKGDVLQPSTELYKKNVLLLRGRFRPVTNVHVDMLKMALARFNEEHDVEEGRTKVVIELTLKGLSENGDIIDRDFLDRVDMLRALGHTVLVSNYIKYYRVSYYLAQFTKGSKIGVVMGIYNLETLFDKKYYNTLNGGILEAFGLGFGHNAKIYVYPAKKVGGSVDEVYRCDELEIPAKMQGLYKHMCDNNRLDGIDTSNEDLLDIYSDNVLAMIKSGDERWKSMVPDIIAEEIIKHKLFGYKEGAKV